MLGLKGQRHEDLVLLRKPPKIFLDYQQRTAINGLAL